MYQVAQLYGKYENKNMDIRMIITWNDTIKFVKECKFSSSQAGIICVFT